MAMLAGTGLFFIQHVLPKVKSRDSVLGIARLIMNWNVDEIVQILEQRGIAYRKDVAEKLRRINGEYSSRDFFQLLGFDGYEDVDFDPAEGCSIVHDMNKRLPKVHENRFDFVFENGTIEHLFDIKTAMGNIARAVKVGGQVCHVSPLDAFNHGFYNFSINFFNDFYRVNGFESFEFFLIHGAANWVENQRSWVEALPYTHEEFYVKPEVYTSPYNKLGIAFLATKREHVPETVTPIQAAYDPALRTSGR